MIGKETSIQSMQQVELASGIRLAYRSWGEGSETLVFIHGMGSNHKAWDKNVPVLSQHFRCLTLDLPNYGESQKGDFPFTMRFFSQVTREFCDSLDLSDPILVGHSMGGQAVLRTLVDDPGLTSRAILIAPAGLETFSDPEIEWLAKSYTPANIAGLSEEQLRRNTEVNFYRFPADAEFMYEESLALRDAPHFHWYCEMIPKSVLGMVTDKVNPQLPMIQAKVLILFGSEDDLIPHPILHQDRKTADVARQGSKIPDSKIILFEDCGHFLQWEKANRFNEEALAFLQSTPDKA